MRKGKECEQTFLILTLRHFSDNFSDQIRQKSKNDLATLISIRHSVFKQFCRKYRCLNNPKIFQ
jgi:hypothetical protein